MNRHTATALAGVLSDLDRMSTYVQAQIAGGREADTILSSQFEAISARLRRCLADTTLDVGQSTALTQAFCFCFTFAVQRRTNDAVPMHAFQQQQENRQSTTDRGRPSNAAVC